MPTPGATGWWWTFGGKLVDEKNNVPSTARRRCGRSSTRKSSTARSSWHAVVARPEQQQGLPRRAISVTNNGISIYYASKNSKDRRSTRCRPTSTTRAIRRGRPACRAPAPVHEPDDLQVHEVSEGGQEFIRFMMEEEQYGACCSGNRYTAALRRLREKPDLDGGLEAHGLPRRLQAVASRGVRRQARLRVCGRARRLHHRGHGRRSRLGDKSPKEAIERATNGPKDTTRFEKQLFRQQEHLGLLSCCRGCSASAIPDVPSRTGTWLGFTDAKIGRTAIGSESRIPVLIGDSVARLSLFNTLFYTIVASVLKLSSGCGWR